MSGARACGLTQFSRAVWYRKSRARDEGLNLHQFASLAEAQAIIAAWRMEHNHCRPHSSLGHLTLSEFAAQGQALWPSKKYAALVKNRLRTVHTSLTAQLELRFRLKKGWDFLR